MLGARKRSGGAQVVIHPVEAFSERGLFVAIATSLNVICFKAKCKSFLRLSRFLTNMTHKVFNFFRGPSSSNLLHDVSSSNNSIKRARKLTLMAIVEKAMHREEVMISMSQSGSYDRVMKLRWVVLHYLLTRRLTEMLNEERQNDLSSCT